MVLYLFNKESDAPVLNSATVKACSCSFFMWFCSYTAQSHFDVVRKSITQIKLMCTALALFCGNCWPIECHSKACQIYKQHMLLLFRYTWKYCCPYLHKLVMPPFVDKVASLLLLSSYLINCLCFWIPHWKIWLTA